jgi:hypothetical protein
VSRLTVAPLAEFDSSGGRVKITAPYGDGRGHQGVDWGTTDGIEVGTPLHAPVDGVMENAGDDGPYTPSGGHTAGRWLWFRGEHTRWKMFHLNRVIAPLGSWVPAGAVIAEVGNTGTQAAHLHLEEHAGSWSSPVDFTVDAYEVIDAGRWPGTLPPPPEDDMTEDDFHRIASMVGGILDNRIEQFTTPNLPWQDGDLWFEVLTRDGCRVRRRLAPGELVALRTGAALAEQPVVDVVSMPTAQRDAVRAWPLIED